MKEDWERVNEWHTTTYYEYEEYIHVLSKYVNYE